MTVSENTQPSATSYHVTTFRIGDVSELDELFLPETMLSQFESVILRVKQETPIQEVYSVIGTLAELDGISLRFAYSSHHDGL